MADLEAIERELDVARERDDNDARVRLITRALTLSGAEAHLTDYFGELAYAYEQLGRFDEAITAMRRALAAGWAGDLDDHPSAQALIADLLLRAGRTEEADAAWLEAERLSPHDPRVHRAAGCAYAGVGLHGKALPRLTKAFELALSAGDDADMVWLLTDERADTLHVLGNAGDELQLRAEQLVEQEEQQERERDRAFGRSRHAARAVAPAKTYVGRLRLAPAPENPAHRAYGPAQRRGTQPKSRGRSRRPVRIAR